MGQTGEGEGRSRGESQRLRDHKKSTERQRGVSPIYKPLPPLYASFFEANKIKCKKNKQLLQQVGYVGPFPLLKHTFVPRESVSVLLFGGDSSRIQYSPSWVKVSLLRL